MSTAVNDDKVFLDTPESGRQWLAALDFERLYTEAERRLSPMSGDPQFPRACVNTVFEKWWANPGPLVGKTVSEAYIHTAVINTAKDALKASAVSKRASMPEDGGADAFTSSAPSVEDHAESNDRFIEWALLMLGLEDRLRKVALMERVHGYTVKQMAEHMGCSPRTIESLQADVRVAMLREKLGLDEGLLCEAHLAAGGPVARNHLSHCSICRGNEDSWRGAGPAAAAMFPGLLVLPVGDPAPGFFAGLIARTHDAVIQTVDLVTRRYQEASIASKAGTVLVAAAVFTGGSAAVVQKQQSPKRDNRGAAKSATAGPTSLVTPIEVPPAQSGDSADANKLADQPAKTNDSGNSADSQDASTRTDAPALAPEGSAQTVPGPAPSAPRSSAGNSSGSGGVGDLAP